VVAGADGDAFMVQDGAQIVRVHAIENYGVEKVLTLRVGETLVRASVPARINVAVEDEVRFGWNADKVIFFDAATGVNLAHKAA
jgi:multiple sugar transport system ATP-binding protein